MHENLLTYGLKNESLIHIADVESGLRCECICPYCKVKLIARKGKIKVHHFAHDKGADCGKAYETALHLLAKEIIKERKTVLIPECVPSKNYFSDSHYKQPQRVINFTDIELEKYINENETIIKPDAVGLSNNYELYIEFAVTHFVDYDKYNKIKKLNKNCIEIDISNIELSREMLIDVIENLPNYTKWIHNSEIDEEYHTFLEKHICETKILIDKAFKASNTFQLPKYGQFNAQIDLGEEESDDFFIEQNKMKKEYLIKLDENRNIYNTSEFDDIRSEFLSNFYDSKNAFDTIEFDLAYSENDIEFTTYIQNINFKGFSPNYILVKNGKVLYCQVKYPDKITKPQFDGLHRQTLTVPLIIISLTKFKYSLPELITTIHKNTGSIFWVSNPKAEAEIIRRKKEKEAEIIKRKKEEQAEERRRRIEYENDIQKYSKNPMYNLFESRFFEDRVKYCPKPKAKIFEEFKKSRFYSHPILKRIIDGEFWNGEKYGDYGRGHIFLNNEKIIIYKEYRLPNGDLINTDHKSCNLLFAGIMNIQRALDGSIDTCKKCKHLIKLLNQKFETTIVCDYKD